MVFILLSIILCQGNNFICLPSNEPLKDIFPLLSSYEFVWFDLQICVEGHSVEDSWIGCIWPGDSLFGVAGRCSIGCNDVGVNTILGCTGASIWQLRLHVFGQFSILQAMEQNISVSARSPKLHASFASSLFLHGSENKVMISILCCLNSQTRKCILSLLCIHTNIFYILPSSVALIDLVNVSNKICRYSFVIFQALPPIIYYRKDQTISYFQKLCSVNI